MWVKRTEEEVARARIAAKRGRLYSAIVSGIFLWSACTLCHGWSRRDSSLFASAEEIPARAIVAGPFGVLLGWLVYRTTKRRTLICPACGAAQGEGPDRTCSCGGHLESLDTMKWDDA